MMFTFQNAASPIMEGIVTIHDHIFFYLVLVFIFVSWWIFRILNKFEETNYSNYDFIKLFYYYNHKNTALIESNLVDNNLVSRFKFVNKYNFFVNRLYKWNSHNTTLEIIWTLIPTVILYLIAVPSFLLLYSMDEIINPSITVKVIGNQWYWSYEYSDYVSKYDDLSFDSYMIPEYELEQGQYRLLEVDNPLVLPINTHVRILVTASDVLHCWAIPSLGVKIDAVPGRLNQISLFLKKFGVFFGQCSEICGVDHGFMPIVLKSVSTDNYIKWLKTL